MVLDTLPQELILDTALHLLKRDDICRGLWAFNKRIFAACEPLITQLAKVKAFEKRMLERFRDPTRKVGWSHLTENDNIKLGFMIEIRTLCRQQSS